jgi:hypothetical protein
MIRESTFVRAFYGTGCIAEGHEAHALRIQEDKDA